MTLRHSVPGAGPAPAAVGTRRAHARPKARRVRARTLALCSTWLLVAFVLPAAARAALAPPAAGRAPTSLPTGALPLPGARDESTPTPTGPAATAPASPGASARAHWLGLAKAGVAAAERAWRAPSAHWYYEQLGHPGPYPLVTIWGAAPLFQTLDAIALAEPTRANKSAVSRFARVAETYWNPRQNGFAPYPNDHVADDRTWFDDNGWWGLSFVNAYRATGDRRFLADATRALRFIAARGWDAQGGGIWWNTSHPYKAGEALATGTLLATLLWRYGHSQFALGQARKFLAWADGPGFSAADRMYRKSDQHATPIDYIQAPLAYAHLLLCRGGEEPGGCAKSQAVVNESLRRFGTNLDFSPQYDAPYLQWSLAIYELTGDRRLYDVAATAADNAVRHGSGNLYLHGWHGEAISAALAPHGMLRTDAATLSVFAWLAVAATP